MIRLHDCYCFFLIRISIEYGILIDIFSYIFHEEQCTKINSFFRLLRSEFPGDKHDGLRSYVLNVSLLQQLKHVSAFLHAARSMRMTVSWTDAYSCF